MAINSKGKITKAQLSQSLIDELLASAGSAGGGSVAIKKYSRTITNSTDRVFIGNEFFDTNTDQLMVFKNSVYLELNEDYIINQDYTISPVDGIWEASVDEPEVFNFICLMNTPGDVMFSGSRLYTESVTEDKLSSELQYKINNGIKQPSTTYRAEKSQIGINDWSTEVNEDGFYTATFVHGLSSKDLIVSGIDIDNGRNIAVSYRILNTNSIEVEVIEKINMNLMVVDSNEMEIVVQPGYGEGMITKHISTDMWVEGEDGFKTYDIVHNLNSKNLIWSAYDLTTGLNLFLSYKIIDENILQVRTDEVYECQVNISYISFNQFFRIDDNNVSENTAYSSSKTKILIDEVNTTLNEVITDLGKSENTKYSTTNGVKEFTCEQDGHTDNIFIEGETLVNLSKIGSRSWNASSNDAVRTRFVDTYAHVFNEVICGGQFTCFNYTDKAISFPHYTREGVFLNRTVSTVEANSCKVFTLDNDTSIVGVDFWAVHGWSKDDLDLVNSSMFSIIKGNHESRNIPYFEGIYSLGQDNKIEITTRCEDGNIFDGIVELGTFNDITGETVVSLKCVRSKNFIKVNPGSKIIFSNDKGYNRNVYYYDINKKYIEWRGNDTYKDVPENCHYIKFRSNIGTTQNDLSVRYKIEYAEKSTTYTNPQFDKKMLSTSLRGISGVNDIISKIGNKYYKIKRFKEISYDDSWQMNWLGSTGAGTTTQINFNIDKAGSGKSVNNIYCLNYSLPTSEPDLETVWVTKSTTAQPVVCIRCLNSKFNNEATAREYLKKVNFKLVYELENPVIEEIPNLDSIIFKGKNIITVDTGLITGNINFETTTSIRSELNVIKNKVSSLDDDVQEEIIYPTLLNGWIPYNDTQTSLLVYKIKNLYFVQGRIKNGLTTDNTIICNIPGLNNSKEFIINTFNLGNNNGRIVVGVLGALRIFGVTDNSLLTFNFCFTSKED